MRRTAIITAALAFGLWATPSRGQPEPGFTEAVHLSRLQAYALEFNPEIKAAEQRWRAAQARPSQEGSLPDPLLNTAYHNESFDRFTQGNSGYMSFLRLGVEQEIPFFGKLGLKQRVAHREADREGALYRATALNIASRLRLAYNDYVLAHKSIEIVRNNTELLSKLTQAAETRYQVGEGLQHDVARAHVELSILLGRLTDLEQQKDAAQALVNAVLNRPPNAPLGQPEPVDKQPLTYTLEQLETLVREQSPRLHAADFGIAGAEAARDLARRQFYPDFVVRADYFNKAALVPEWEVGVGIRVPLYFWRKQAPAVREANAMVNHAHANRQTTLQEVLGRIKELYAQAVSADRLVELYGSGVVPQADISLRSASAAYEVGQVDFLTLLNSFTVLNEYQLRYFEELAKFDKALAQIEELAGVLPERASRSEG